MRRQIILAFAAASLALVQAAHSAPQVRAPESVRELLATHLSLVGAGDNALDEAARVTLERRLRKDAGELLATEGYFSPQIELRDGTEGLVVQVEPGPQAHIGGVNIQILGAVSLERRQQLIKEWTLPTAAAFRRVLQAHPERYIAQPTLSLSSCPTYVEQGIAPRHIDLRPFVLAGESVQMVAGGLTRVALKEGSLVVNSSQGGGTKDTWVV